MAVLSCSIVEEEEEVGEEGRCTPAQQMKKGVRARVSIVLKELAASMRLYILFELIPSALKNEKRSQNKLKL